ncbi:MAG TPA: GerW family sporulation protein [Candidatus Merdivicinus intestinavium]|nr:GerW family sporulation protein [Candidatus Merdivicinus intestinavium]
MAEQHPIEGLMGTTMQKIKEMVDVNTIIGDPVTTPDGTTIIPVSKVSFGFASGGSDLPTQNPKQTFGGGGGAGITIQPLAFLVVHEGEVKLLQLATSSNTAEKIVNTVPDVIDKISDAIAKNKAEKAAPREHRAPASEKQA